MARFTNTSNQEVVYFYSGKPEKYSSEDSWKHVFSNFSEHPVFYNGRLWPTSEHAFQAAKMVKDEDKEKIFNVTSPMEAAKLGRSLQMRPTWDAEKVQVMKDILIVKFSKSGILRDHLNKTGKAYLEERTKNDSFWGSGSDDPNGPGKNMLGKLLMEIRDE